MEPNSNNTDFNFHSSAYLDSQITDEINDHRVDQTQLESGVVKPRALGDIVQASHSDLGDGLSASLAIPNGSSGTFTFGMEDKEGRTILAVPDISWYFNTVSEATQWPNVNFGMGNSRSTVWNDFGLSDNVGVKTRLIVRNDTGSTQTVIAIVRWRYIIGAAAVLPVGQSSSS